jgi:transposase
MSMLARKTWSVPGQTARVARAIYPEGNQVMRMLDVLHLAVADSDYADLFPARGQPAESPARLALVTLLQFMEGLTDRQAAEAVRTRIDWKYLLGLDLTDPGFDHTVLSEFRTRLLSNNAERRLFDAVIKLARSRDLLHAGGRQRSDSTHILGKVRTLTRYELVAETLRHALDTLSEAAPSWLREHITPDWVDRYGLRASEFRMPKGSVRRKEWITALGADGMLLLAALNEQDTPVVLRSLPPLETLRQVWLQNFAVDWSDGTEKVTWRAWDNVPVAGDCIASPHDVEVRACSKGSTEWVGFRLHLTETCDKETPNLITNVETTPATVTDGEMTPVIHATLQQRSLLPAIHIADTAYVDSMLLVQSRDVYHVNLIGPSRRDNLWQAKEADGFALSDFKIDFVNQQAICPAGKISQNWRPALSEYGKQVIRVRWSRNDCCHCEVAQRCTRSVPPQRQITVLPQAQYEALRERRALEKTSAFADEYSLRAGVEGTIFEAVRVHGMRQTRYVGTAKTHLAHLMTAAAVNVQRLLRWLAGEPKAQVTQTPFQKLYKAAA